MKTPDILIAAIVLLFSGSCSDTPSSAPEHAHDHSHDAAENQPLLNHGDYERFQLTACSATSITQSDSIAVRGVVDAPPQSVYDIALPYGGQVIEMNYYEGAFAKKGAILAKVRHLAYIALQEEYLQLKAREKETSMALKRQETLDAEGNTSEKAFQEALAAQSLVLSGINGVEARLRLSGIDPALVMSTGIQEEVSLRAPVSGYLTNAFAHLGVYLAPDAPVYRMIDPEHLHLELSVYQDQVQHVAQGQKVWFSFDNGRSQHRGEVFLVSHNLDPEKKTVNVHVHPDEDVKGLIPGMYVTAAIVTSARPTNTLPEGSAVSKQGKWHGLRAKEAGWEVVVFDENMVTGRGMVEVMVSDTARYVCKNLERALAFLLETGEEKAGHRH